MTETTATLVKGIDPVILEKVLTASESYKAKMKERNGRSAFNFELWHKFATLLVTFEDAIEEMGIKDKQVRDQILRAYCLTARSTARKHRQIYEVLHLIPNPEQYPSWKALSRAAVAVTN